MQISDKNNLFTWAQKLAFHQCTPSYSSIPFFTLSCSLRIEQHSPLASFNIFTCLSQAFVRPPFIWRTDHRWERNAFFSLKVLESHWDLFCLGGFFFSCKRLSYWCMKKQKVPMSDILHRLMQLAAKLLHCIWRVQTFIHMCTVYVDT